MISSGSRTGWQTTLADLALILFMVTAAAIVDKPGDADEVHVAPAGMETPLRGEPLAVYRATPGAPPLAEWLAAQPHDGRQHLTILARHPAGGAATAAAGAVALGQQAGAAGYEARIVLEPGGTEELVAMLEFDGRQGASPAFDPEGSD